MISDEFGKNLFNEIHDQLTLEDSILNDDLTTLSVRMPTNEKEALNVISEKLYEMKLSELVRYILSSYLKGAELYAKENNDSLLREIYKAKYPFANTDEKLDDLMKRLNQK